MDVIFLSLCILRHPLLGDGWMDGCLGARGCVVRAGSYGSSSLDGGRLVTVEAWVHSVPILHFVS